MSGTKFVVVKMKELVKTAVFAVLGVVILAGLIYFFTLGTTAGTARTGTVHIMWIWSWVAKRQRSR